MKKYTFLLTFVLQSERGFFLYEMEFLSDNEEICYSEICMAKQKLKKSDVFSVILINCTRTLN